MVVALLAAACSNSDSDKATDSSSSVNAPPEQSDATAGLGLSLSEGAAAGSESVEVVSVVDGEALSDEDLEAISIRLGELEPAPPNDGYERPDDSLPPPRTGKTVDTPFPVDAGDPPPIIAEGPLEVLRYQPRGDVDIAPFLSVTFNQPMVPITTVGQLDDTAVPIQLEPELSGRWIWLGTRTVRFEHSSDLIDRLPMATTYTVTVPAGTTSQTGSELAEQVEWTFTTPPPQLQSFTPTGMSLPLEPVFVATFDQHVGRNQILAVTELTIDGESQPISLADEAEIAADKAASAVAERLPEGRWVAFVADATFDPATAFTVTIGGDIPSVEGPATNPEPQTRNLSTYAPLQVIDQSCTEEPCDPRWGELWLNFNNELDLEVFDPDMVSIEPQIPFDVRASGSSISIQASTQPSTTYSVSLSAELTDVFAQQLGDTEPLTFEVGPARDRLGRFDNILITTDPLTDDKSISIDSVGHAELRVRVLDVDVDDYAGTVKRLSRVYEQSADLPSWRVIENRIVEVHEPETLSQVEIDLPDALVDGDGHVVAIVESTETYDRESEDYWENRPAMAWVQSSTIGLDAFTDPSQLVVWTTDLATGAPLAEVSVGLAGSGAELTTGPDGVAIVEIPAGDSPYMVARLGEESTILDAWVSHQTVLNRSLFSITTDRGTYRPGETASVKGFLRRLLLAEDAQLHLPPRGKVGWTARDAQYNEIATGEAKLSSLGGFDFEFEIPPGANLGQSVIEFVDLEHTLQKGQASYAIQEFRRPEFEVTTQPQTGAPFYVGEPTTVSVNASYYAGGPLPDAEVDWEVTTQQTNYQPPDWDEFSFGIVRPYWIENDGYYGGDYGYEECCFEDYDYSPIEPVEPEYFSGRTDADGSHHVQINTEADDEGQPSAIRANATVYDVNRQAWSSESDFLVHPGEFYVGLRSDQTFVTEGDPLVIDAIVVDVDGEVATGRDVTLEAGRLASQYVDGQWTDVVVETQTCDETSAEEPVTCTFDTDPAGTYQIEATVSDDSDRASISQITRWVDGSGE
ncbi:MAG: hypothetical protein IH940_12750, partial [Acidobacteria bacterium]|nr:hypothetical protein [Acidobacteriota bacterium]